MPTYPWCGNPEFKGSIMQCSIVCNSIQSSKVNCWNLILGSMSLISISEQLWQVDLCNIREITDHYVITMGLIILPVLWGFFLFLVVSIIEHYYDHWCWRMSHGWNLAVFQALQCSSLTTPSPPPSSDLFLPCQLFFLYFAENSELWAREWKIPSRRPLQRGNVSRWYAGCLGWFRLRICGL